MGEEQFEEEDIFPIVTPDRAEKLKKFEALLQKRDYLTYENKLNLILNGMKPKTFDSSFRKLRCPYYKCLQIFPNDKSLKGHIEKSHKELIEMGLTIKNGTFEWSNQALDFVLMTTKLYPNFVAKIVKEVASPLFLLIGFRRQRRKRSHEDESRL